MFHTKFSQVPRIFYVFVGVPKQTKTLVPLELETISEFALHFWADWWVCHPNLSTRIDWIYSPYFKLIHTMIFSFKYVYKHHPPRGKSFDCKFCATKKEIGIEILSHDWCHALRNIHELILSCCFKSWFIF